MTTFKELVSNIETILKIEMRKRCRKDDYVMARQIALYIGYEYFDFVKLDMCKELGFVHGTESYHFLQIERLLQAKDRKTHETLSHVIYGLDIKKCKTLISVPIKKYNRLMFSFNQQKRTIIKLNKQINELTS